ncbi:hypothetical protein KY289_005919 [Solanum tuberosum]|nr:hypothetical protein KY289_005919 [Solanum tuberosum]
MSTCRNYVGNMESKMRKKVIGKQFEKVKLQRGNCGGEGVIKDYMGYLIFAYSLRLGQGSSNWAEAKALLFGVNWCIDNGYDIILTESNSKLLVECVNDLNQTPWRILKEVSNLKVQMENIGFILQHCYREANKVADNLVSLSFVEPHNQTYEAFVDLPAEARGLMTMDR